MATPVVTAEIAFATDPAVAPTWVNVSSYLQAFSYQRGRQAERDQVQAGTAALLLNNLDRRFDPTHSGGPYYPNVVPMRRARISAVWNSITYRLFSGYVESWSPEYPGPIDSDVPAVCADGFKVFALKSLNASFSQQLSGARIGAVLDAIGWPAGDRVIGTGNSMIQAVALVNVSALQHLQDVVAAENGLFFVRGDGYAIFQQRTSRLLPPYIVSQGTFGDAAGELPYADVALDYDDTQLWNEVRMTRQGGVEQVAQDTASQTRYYPRTLTKTGLLITTDNEVLDGASWLLGRYKDPKLRIASISLNGEGDPANLWPQILGRELGDRVTVRRRPPGGGAMIEQPSFIESLAVSWAAAGGLWDAAWTLSAADSATYWILEDAVAGLLDTTTVLSY